LRRRGAPPATPPQAPKPNTATSPFPTPTKGPPPPLPGKKPSQNPQAVQTLESTFGAAPANGGADPFSSNGLGAMGAGTGGADPFMHPNGIADETDPFVVPPPNSAPPPPLGPPPPVGTRRPSVAHCVQVRACTSIKTDPPEGAPGRLCLARSAPVPAHHLAAAFFGSRQARASMPACMSPRRSASAQDGRNMRM
jgi:hypothetical protein